MRSGTRPAPGEGIEFVSCKLCRCEYRMINQAHLIRRHGFDPEHPVRDYLARFPGHGWQAKNTLRRRRRSVIRFYERVGRRWDRGRLLRLVRDRLHRGLRVDIRAMRGVAGGAVTAAKAKFGRWNLLLRAAGLEVRPRILWNRDLVHGTLREEALKGRDLSSQRISERWPGLYAWVMDRWDSWEEGLRAAGLDPKKYRKRRSWSKETVLLHLRRLGRPLRQKEILELDPGLYSATFAYLGSWPKALRRAGLGSPPRHLPYRWTREAILEAIKKRASDGLSLKSDRVRQGQSMLPIAARREFGSWREAIRAAGCEKYHPARESWTRGELLVFLKEAHRKHGYVSAGLLKRLGRPGFIPPMSAIKRLFGGIGKAKRAIGATEDGRSFWRRGSSHSHGSG